jgi:hypothetical protein
MKLFTRKKAKAAKPDEPIEKQKKELEKLIDKAKRDLEYWHKTFRSFSVVPCAYCKKQMRVYPYGGAYYHIKDNRKVHAECYDAYLVEKEEA